jgi:peptidoglycan/xylan/chitin deacetylase (PgdA/CDA1 family)
MPRNDQGGRSDAMSKVTITFDNGPEASVTHHCLDVLGKYGIKTTFFAIGMKLRDKDNYNALVRAHAEGHWIGNHSYTHGRSLGSDPSRSLFDEEVTQAQELIGDLSHPDKLFRPFFNAGVLDNRLFRLSDIERLKQEKYTCVFYDTLCGDWGDGEVWVSRALASIGRKPWSSLILHDIIGYPDGYRTNSMRRLEEFIIRARGDGHELVQEFAPEHVPMLRGEMTLPMDSWTN